MKVEPVEKFIKILTHWLFSCIDYFCIVVSAVQLSGSDCVERGNMIQLVCNASGRPDPPHDIEWFRNDVPIHSDSKSGVLITKKIETRFLVSILAIRYSRMADSGEYTCKTSSRDFASVKVNVLNGGCVCHV